MLLRGRRRGELLVVLSAIGLLLLAVAPIGPAMMLVLEQRFPRPPKLPDRIDGILVLGGAVDPRISLSYGETVFNGSIARVLAGVALARHHPDAKLALVGGEGEFFPVGGPLPGRLQSRSKNGSAGQFQPARWAQHKHRRRQGVGGPRRLSAARMDQRTVSRAIRRARLGSTGR